MGKPLTARQRAEIAVQQFAGLLRGLRIAAGLTQWQLAEAVEVSPARISEYENGARSPSWETALALAFALGVSPDSLYRQRAKR